jgi:hypothetical protein
MYKRLDVVGHTIDPTHGVLLGLEHGEYDFTARIFLESKDGVGRNKILAKKKNLKDESKMNSLWKQVEGNRAIRITKPQKLFAGDGDDGPKAYGIAIVQEDDSDDDNVRTVLDERWGGSFFGQAKGGKGIQAGLTDGWDASTIESLGGPSSSSTATEEADVSKLAPRELIVQKCDKLTEEVDAFSSTCVASRYALKDLTVETVSDYKKKLHDLIKKYSKQLTCSKESTEERERGTATLARMNDMVTRMLGLHFAGEFAEEMSGDIDDESVFEVGPTSIKIICDAMTRGGLTFAASDFMYVAMDRQSHFFAFTGMVDEFVKTLGKEGVEGRFTLSELPVAQHEELQASIVISTVEYVLEMADGDVRFANLMVAMYAALDIILSEEMTTKLKDLHVLAIPDEYGDEIVFDAVAGLRNPVHLFFNACNKAPIICTKVSIIELSPVEVHNKSIYIYIYTYIYIYIYIHIYIYIYIYIYVYIHI